MRIHRGRSLLAAIALLISGGIIAQIVNQYVSQEATVGALTRSRLWWEIVLNLQLLSIGMVWFYFSDRISDSEGRHKFLQISMFCLAMFSTVMPSILAAVSAANDWFSIRPTMESFIGFFLFGVVLWGIALVLQNVLLRVTSQIAGIKPRRRSIWFYGPVMLLSVITMVDIVIIGGRLWLVATPVLLYIQGALPYIIHAFTPKRNKIRSAISSQSGSA